MIDGSRRSFRINTTIAKTFSANSLEYLLERSYVMPRLASSCNC